MNETSLFGSLKAKDKHGVTIEWDRKALDFLVNGYDINYGARSIKHEVERRVVNQLAVAHEYGLIENGSNVIISADLSSLDDPNSKSAEQNATKSATNDIRLRKVTRDKNTNQLVYQDLNLKMNSFGKYFIPSEKNQDISK